MRITCHLPPREGPVARLPSQRAYDPGAARGMERKRLPFADSSRPPGAEIGLSFPALEHQPAALEAESDKPSSLLIDTSDCSGLRE